MEPDQALCVIKRNGDKVPVRFDAITERNEILCGAAFGRPLLYVKDRLQGITRKVIDRFVNGMTTEAIDNLTLLVCSTYSKYHYEYSQLAARIVVNNLHKSTDHDMAKIIKKISEQPLNRLSDEFVGIVIRGASKINKRLNYNLDYKFDFFGINTFCKSYSLKFNGDNSKVATRPQHDYMRIALSIWVCTSEHNGHELPETEFNNRLENAFHYYDMLSTHKMSHASPAFFNAGTTRPQMASCFLLNISDDLNSMLKFIKDSANISKFAGGIGVNLSNIRAKGQPIKSTGGTSNGIIKFLPLIDDVQIWIEQGGGKRKGALAAYIEPWHADIIDFIHAGRFKGTASNVAPNLKYALWVCNLFMETLKRELAGGDGTWYVFSPDKAPGLSTTHGVEFETLYTKYVEEGLYETSYKASYIITEWFKTVMQKGNPYILFKDHINHKSNLSHIKTIEFSNLCAEITIPATTKEYGTCNLGALPLESFVVYDVRANNNGHVRYSWQQLMDTTKTLTHGLNNLIDISFYVTPECEKSNKKYRPLAIGVIGLANVFARFKYIYGSKNAIKLDAAIHAVIYYGAMLESSRLGKLYGNFDGFEGSPSSKGILQPDMWVEQGHLDPNWEEHIEKITDGFLTKKHWDDLRCKCSKYLRNGYVTASMPTATTSQVTGQNECFEPFTSNSYTRKTLVGENTVLNKYMVDELNEIGKWDEEMKNDLLLSEGSIQNIERIPPEIKKLFKTARELDQRLLISHSAARGPFISQSQSLNSYLENPSLKECLTNMLYGYESGVTTSSYYIHTVSGSKLFKSTKKETKKPFETIKFDFSQIPNDDCESCAL